MIRTIVIVILAGGLLANCAVMNDLQYRHPAQHFTSKPVPILAITKPSVAPIFKPKHWWWPFRPPK